MNKLFENWRSHLNETSDDAFLDELEPLLSQWQELQTQYGEKGENIPPEELPKYVQKSPKYYKGYTHHPSGRRGVFAQTTSEESIEKNLIKLFMKHSDQSYLTSGIHWLHDLSYKAHAQKPWDGAGFNYADFSRADWVKAQGQRQRDVLSCHGFDKSETAPRAGAYGFFVKPSRVLYASKSDLATQTLRTAHADVRARFSNKLPKRAGMDKLKSTRTGKSMRMYADWRRWIRKTFSQLPKDLQTDDLWSEISAASKSRDSHSPEAIEITDKVTSMMNAAGIQGDAPPRRYSQNEMRALRDNTLLNQKDVMANRGKVEEGLMANWEISGWYALMDGRGVTMAPFWKKILPNIRVPFYGINQFENTMREIPLEELRLMLS